MNIARTTLSSKILTQHKNHFAKLTVAAVMRLKGSGNLEAIKVIKKLGGALDDSYLEEGEWNPVLLGPAVPFTSLLLGALSSLSPSLPPSQGFYWRRRQE